MSILDGPLRTVAQTVLNTFGKAGTLVLVTPGAYDPATGNTAAPTEASFSVRAISEQYKARFAIAESDGVRQGDLQRTIAALGVSRQPANTDRYTEDSITYKVVHVDIVSGGDLGVLYILHLKR